MFQLSPQPSHIHSHTYVAPTGRFRGRFDEIYTNPASTLSFVVDEGRGSLFDGGAAFPAFPVMTDVAFPGGDGRSTMMVFDGHAGRQQAMYGICG